MSKVKYFLSAAVLVSFFAIVGCGGDDPEGIAPKDAIGQRLAGTWEVGTSSTVTFGSPSEDRTSVYSDFTLTFTYDAATSSGTYTATGGETGASPWPASGTWSFTDVAAITNANSAFSITRNNLEITVSSLTDTNLSMNFTFNDAIHDGGRTQAVNGTWQFNSLEKQ